MKGSRRIGVAMLATAVLAGSAAAATLTGSAASAHGASAGQLVLAGSLLPSEPGFPSLHGLTPNSAPWLLGRSKLELRSSGALLVKIKGLIIPNLGTAGSVTSIDASLYCANETTPAVTTASVPLSTKGDATIETTVSLPLTCLTPVVLFNPNGSTSTYVASTGLGSY
jgi:hypothetical protein